MRAKRLIERIQKTEAHAALITSGVNVRYYSGFSGTDSQLLVTAQDNYLFTDFRYTEQAEKETDCTVVETKATERIGIIFDYIKKDGAKRIGIDLSDAAYTLFKSCLLNIGEDRIADISPEIYMQRSVKDEREIKLITQGARLNDELFSYLCSFLRPGISEMDVKAEIIYYMLKNGADSAFDPIVASGQNSSMPHAVLGDKKIASGDFVTMDFGCRIGGYCSDFTRTVAISHIDKEMQKVYDIVNEAGKAAFGILKAGAKASDIDAAARDIITKAGYGAAFGHGLGHGVGLDIHESPTLNATSEDTLKAGMVVTVEPGIYLKGKFGVRIEDLCVVRESGLDNLNTAPRDIIII